MNIQIVATESQTAPAGLLLSVDGPTMDGPHSGVFLRMMKTFIKQFEEAQAQLLTEFANEKNFTIESEEADKKKGMLPMGRVMAVINQRNAVNNAALRLPYLSHVKGEA
ncbi:MAG: hypothetical protein JWO03_909 [Bacteroidetes bacterium]|nr:hypothetical protein [Bacteroidota bacterium]